MEFRRQKRIIQTFWIFIFCFALLLCRLFVVQIRHAADYAAKAEAQQNQIIPLEEVARGDILDRNKVPLTGSGFVPKVIVLPYLMKDKVTTAQRLGSILQADPQVLLERFAGRPGMLPNEISLRQAQAIKRMRLEGVQVYYIKKRYDVNPLAVHLIGHLGKISGAELARYASNPMQKAYSRTDLVGKIGLERYYERWLKGTRYETYLQIPTDAKNRPLKGLDVKVNKVKDPGRNHLILTIDKRIQLIVEQALDRHKIAAGAVVVMDIRSGDILALASRPVFDPNNISSALQNNDQGNVFLDNCLQFLQPGSVFKPVVAAAALELGAVRPDSRFLCLGERDEPVKCYRKEGHGLISFAEAMAYSCNPVFARVGQKIGAANLIEYARKLGFAENGIIGIPHAGDAGENLAKLTEPYTIVNSSIGQGPVLVTPVQVTAMMAAIAGDGIYKKPRLVMGILDSNYNLTKAFAPDAGERALSPETSRTLREMFKGVTTMGTGKLAYVPGWGSAGKTGSAQVDKNQGIVDAWFTGYAPLDAPRYAVTVLIKGGESGGKSAAPVFREIMETMLMLE
ncbi:peptidoglycan D,D-transpeptidase FtsI family protein [Thermincola ferriacetica]